MEQEVLRTLGFSERETKVYLALLELGSVTVGPIAAKTRLQHSKVYQTLEKLIDKGLVTFVFKSRTKHFQAEDPRRILSMIKEKEKIFQEILPKLEQKQKESQTPQTAKVYEGYKAIKSMYESLFDELTKRSYYYVFAFKDEYVDASLAARFLRTVHQKLSEKGVDDRLLVHKSVRKEFLKNYFDLPRIHYRFISLNIPFGLMIIDDKIINWVWGKRPTAVVIISQQMAHQYKAFFLEFWKQAKEK